MSTYAEQPFTEFEERYFLAEILKKSALPPAALLSIIREAGIEPAWTEIALPNGRSVSACQQAYSALFSRTALPPTQLTDPSRRLKRPFSSMGDATTALPRELQPRPPTFASVNGQQIPIPAPAMMSPVEPQRKKRGRPTKSEFERRQQEARERGEVWPKPRKPKARPSTEGSEAGPSTGGGASSSQSGVVASTEGFAISSGPPPLATLAGIAPTAAMYSPGTPSTAPQPPTPGSLQGMLQPSETAAVDVPTPQGQGRTAQESERPGEGLEQHGQAHLNIKEAQRLPPQGTLGSTTYAPAQSHQFQPYPSEGSWQSQQQSQHRGRQGS